MEQLEKVIEELYKGLVKKPENLAKRVTQSRKEVVVLQYADTETIMILEETDPVQQGSITTLPKQCYLSEQHVKSLNDAGRVLLSCIDARKSSVPEDLYVLLSVWSKDPFSTVLLYALSLRLWKKVLPRNIRSSAFDSILSAYDRMHPTESVSLPKTYSCIHDATLLPVDNDVKFYSASLPEDSFLSSESVFVDLAKDLERKRTEEADVAEKINNLFSGNIGLQQDFALPSDVKRQDHKQVINEEWAKRVKISLKDAQKLAVKNHHH